jgi:AbrB family looped-hinge helix DNA binding protein
MKTKLSSKGQLIIPKAIRRSLALGSGSLFNIEVNNRKIILEPIKKEALVDLLYGKYEGTDLLGPLENEHKREIQDEPRLRS